ncbi:MAG: hypothetical protein ABR521_08275 [Gaiellaceae bacterium]
MFPFLHPLGGAILDVGRDDYYGHSGAWWDVQDSPFLAHLDAPAFPLAVAVAGGPGTVASDLPGIACPPGCAVPFDAGTVVSLTAVEVEGARFARWSGACSGAESCTVTMDGAKSVTALFALQISVRLRVLRRGGGGSVESEDDSCTGSCELSLDQGARVRLTAVPDARSRFLGWSGACRGRGTCTVTAAEGVTVLAAFGPGFYRVTAAVTGRGRVASEPAGLACRTACGASFKAGTRVRVRATADPGWRFAGWSGACRGPGACRLTADGARSVRARFVRR